MTRLDDNKFREPEGFITVELYDNEERRRVKEVKTHNFIGRLVKNYYYRLVFNSLFTRNVVGKGGELDLIAGRVSNPFGIMMLTTADHAENPTTERYIKGDLVGYAYTSKSYSEGSPLRGTLNINESLIRPDKARFVFDFATDKANGTFESIYFGFDGEPYKSSDLRGVFESIPNSDFSDLDIVCCKKYNGMLYVIPSESNSNRDRGVKILVYDLATMNLVKTITLGDMNRVGISGFYNLTFYDNKMYINGTDAGKISIYNITDGTVTTKSIGFGSDAVFCMEYIPSRNYFIAVKTARTSSLTTLHILDTDLEIVGTMDIVDIDGYDGFKYDSNTNTRAIVADGDDLILRPLHVSSNAPSLRLKRLNNTTYVKDLVQPNIVTGVWDDTHYVSNKGVIIPKGDLSSRVKLPEPVTKTAANTMKITYEFVLPQIGW